MSLKEYLSSKGVLKEFRVAVFNDNDYKRDKYEAKSIFGDITYDNIILWAKSKSITGVDFEDILRDYGEFIAIPEILECLEDFKRPSIFKNNSVTE